MKKISAYYLVVLYVFLRISIFAQNDLKYSKDHNASKAANIYFTENKGQTHDQNYKPRTDVLFSGTDEKIVYHLKRNGISYQLSKTDSEKINTSEFAKHTRATQTQPDQISISRLDINWLNSNQNSKIIKGTPNKGYDNYYLENCPNGVLHVQNYREITYQNIYTGIDLKWYGQSGHLKYDYIVAAGADYKQIKLDIKGAEKIYINEQGELEIKTSLGTIIEQAPVVTQNTQLLKATWVIKNNIVSYNIEHINPNQPFIIDPMVRSWGTYYGAGASVSNGYTDCTTDSLNNVYLSGMAGNNSGSTIATSGSYQTVFGGQDDAYLAKFDSSGTRLWGTYYGGSGGEYATSCATDINHNVYLSGYTNSNSNNAAIIATPGSHQSAYMGQYDGFLVKFDAAGVRQWGTYYGGSDFDEGTSCTTDQIGNVYLVGYTGSNTGISTPGSHQSIFSGQTDAFLVKFNTNGVRQWATYYGGVGQEYGYACAVDINDNIYMAGNTNFSLATIIATTGSHQPSPGGLNDAFLVKFNSSGTRQWATYYGGNADEGLLGCATDGTDVYLSGYTESATGSIIATSGSHQPIHGGGTSDAFLVKFNGSGIRQWGTYYGGTSYDYGGSCAIDFNHNVYMSGSSNSATGIATACSHQPILGGNEDAFLAKFNSSGLRQWSTYYGGLDYDYGRACTTDHNHHVYLAGNAFSVNAGTIIATPGSFQSNNLYSGYFLVNFFDDTSTVVNIIPPQNQTICANNSATLSAISNGAVSWYNIPNGGTAINTGSMITTPVLSSGTYTYYLESSNCISTTTRTAVSVTVNALPIISITTASSTICAGNSTSINATGATNYSWSPSISLSSVTGANVIASPTITTNYTVTGSAGNCVNSQALIVGVNAIPSLSLSVASSPTICLGNVINLGVTGASSYVWLPPAGLNSTTTSNVIANPSITTQYTVTGYNGNCTDSKVIDVYVNPPFNIAVSPTSYSMCSGNSTVLYATGASNFSWTPGSGLSATTGSLVNANPSTTTVYTVTGYQNNCYNSQQFTITVVPSPVINITSDLIIYEGNSVTLSASGGGAYVWSPNENISCTNCDSIIVSPTKSTTYCVEVTGANSCSNSKCVNVTVDINCGELFVPNAFSPNEDGINDVLHVKINPKCVSGFTILIFDRWGEKIFESDDLNFSWDGTFRGKALNTSVFVYHIKLKLHNKELLTKKGNITLIK